VRVWRGSGSGLGDVFHFDVSRDDPKALQPDWGGRFVLIGAIGGFQGKLGSSEDLDTGGYQVGLFTTAHSAGQHAVVKCVEPEGIDGRVGAQPGVGECYICTLVYGGGWNPQNPPDPEAISFISYGAYTIDVLNFSQDAVMIGGDQYGVAVRVKDAWILVADECDTNEEESEGGTSGIFGGGGGSAGGGLLRAADVDEHGRKIETINMSPVQGQKSSGRKFFADMTSRSGNLFVTKELSKTATFGRRFSMSVPRTTVGRDPSYAPYSFRAKGLPSGLALNKAVGSISGTIGQTGDAEFVCMIIDCKGNQDSCKVKVKNRKIGVRITVPTDTGKMEKNVSYTGGVTVTGGSGSYSVSSTTLPAGVYVGSSGSITGAPTANGTVNTTITVSAGYGENGDAYPSSVVFSNVLTFVTTDPLVVVNPTDLTLSVGTAYSSGNSISQTGGASAYTYAISALPAGLSLNASTGAITGTPSGAATVSAVATVTDSAGRAATSSFAFVVAAALAVVDPTNLSLTVGVAYTSGNVISATGGTAPYTFAISALPAGLSLNTSTGAITGTPLGGGTVSATATVTDSAAVTATSTFNFVTLA
jgi:hypothetical protein